MAALGWWVKTPKPALSDRDLRAGAPGEGRLGSTRMAALGRWVKTPKPALPNCDLM